MTIAHRAIAHARRHSVACLTGGRPCGGRHSLCNKTRPVLRMVQVTHPSPTARVAPRWMLKVSKPGPWMNDRPSRGVSLRKGRHANLVCDPIFAASMNYSVLRGL